MKHNLLVALAAVTLTLAGIIAGTAATQTETGTSTSEPVPIVPPPITTEPTGPVADMLYGDFRTRRIALLRRVNAIRSNKCLAAVRFRHPSWKIRPDRRAENLAYWRTRVAKNLARPSNCFPARMYRAYLRIPSSVRANFLCLHRHEGAWNDPNAPYYGGLQMDLTFQRTYGRDALAYYGGTADRWDPWVQIVVANRARVGYGPHGPRGYGPWPSTRITCGI